MKKRLLTLLLALCMICSLLPLGVLADGESEHEHSYEEKVVEPTCTEKGYTLYTCECGDEYEANEVPATGHDTELKNAKEATCTAGGYSGDKVCKTCGETLEKGNNVAALGHNFKDGKCTRCGEKSATNNENPFVDVKDSEAYYFDPVFWAVGKNITKGVDYTHFAPEKDCTRAQIVTFLWRANGSPEPKKYTSNFEDISEKAYYYKAVFWAIENGITKGVDKTHFAPDDTCTRAQAVTFLWRAKGSPDPTSTKNPFEDVSKEAFYYMAMLWAVGNEITKGVDATHFAPEQTCTRGHIVTFLYRAMA